MAKVVVTGSINIDVVASTERHPKPGETVRGSALRFFPGGKGANQSVAAARSGASTVFVGAVGDDPFGTDATRSLLDAGVDSAEIRVVVDAPTGVALIIVDAQGENSIVVVPGANGRLQPADAERVRIDGADVAVAQLEIPAATTTAALAHARAAGATTILNAAPAPRLSRALNDLADVLVVNEIELNAIARSAINRESPRDEIHAAVQVLDRTEGRSTVVTLGPRGAVAVVGDRLIEIPGRAVTAVDTTGAGDCFVGALAARLLAGDGLEPALAFANVAASICVERPGAGPSMPTIAEVRGRDS